MNITHMFYKQIAYTLCWLFLVKLNDTIDIKSTIPPLSYFSSIINRHEWCSKFLPTNWHIVKNYPQNGSLYIKLTTITHFLYEQRWSWCCIYANSITIVMMIIVSVATLFVAQPWQTTSNLQATHKYVNGLFTVSATERTAWEVSADAGIDHQSALDPLGDVNHFDSLFVWLVNIN